MKFDGEAAYPFNFKYEIGFDITYDLIIEKWKKRNRQLTKILFLYNSQFTD